MNPSLRPGRHARIAVGTPATAEAARAFDAFCTAEELPPSVVWRLGVALDEIVGNIVAHGAEDGAAPAGLDVWFARQGPTIEITVTDDGPAFNPLLAADPDVSGSLASREPGGLGIMLVKSLMDDVRYERTTRNILTIRKHIDLTPREGGTGPMDIQESNHAGVTVIAPRGRIDTTSSAALEDALRRAVDGGARDLIVDFSSVDYISSAGLRVFLVLAKKMRDLHGRLVLCAMPEPVSQVFRLAGFTSLFRVEPTQTQALATFATPS